MSQTPAICNDLEAILRDAPTAVDSFHPGHWAFMTGLEGRAQKVVTDQDIEKAAEFLADVAYLKRPHNIDRRVVRAQLLEHRSDIGAALQALLDVDRLDYQAMEVLARLPWFGRSGGRAFNSAVFRLLKPRAFGIIDWRNVAVLAGAAGFEGLVNPPVRFTQFSNDEILTHKGHLPFTSDVYRQYNDALRALGQRHGRTAAEIDLILWTYSIHRQPFPPLALPAFSSHFVMRVTDPASFRQDPERAVEQYLARLKETGPLTREQLIVELAWLFTFISSECEAFGQGKRGRIKERVKLIVTALGEAIASKNPERLLSLWTRWQNMVDPSSPNWIGIDLPGSMAIEGYMVLEHFIPVKRYFESFYDMETLEPTYACD